MTGAAARQDVDAWDRFVRTPSLGAHPAYLSELFDGALTTEAAIRLGGAARFAGRMSQLIARRHGLADIDAPADAADRAIALSSAEELEALTRRAGAVCWADPIAREIRAPQVAALKEGLGEDAYAAALGNREEALSPVDLDLGETSFAMLGQDRLVAGALESGRRCLVAWLSTQPRGVSDRVRLKLAPDLGEVDADDAYRAYGPQIIRRVAA